MFDIPEHEWKPWRAIFSPAFSDSYLRSLIPQIVEETMIYHDVLKEKAERKAVFQLDTTTLWFTMDVIGRITMCTILNNCSTLKEIMLTSPQGNSP